MPTKILHAPRLRLAAIMVLVLALLATSFFMLRRYRSMLVLRSAYVLGVPELSSIRGWMTLPYVADTYRMSPQSLTDELDVPPRTDLDTTLRNLAEARGVTSFAYVQAVQRAIARSHAATPPPPAPEDDGWWDWLGTEFLSALMVYGYPALGAVHLLGAIGMPVPTGLAAAVSGALSELGRLNWIWAGLVTVLAATLGDAVGYRIGRWLSAAHSCAVVPCSASRIGASSGQGHCSRAGAA